MISHRLLAGLCAALLPLTSFAIPVTYEFSGEVSVAGAGGDALPSDPEMFVPFIPWGGAFSGSFTYESETPAFEAPGYLSYQGAITEAKISFGPGGSLGRFSFAAKPIGPYTSQSSLISIINDLEFEGNPPIDQFGMTMAFGNGEGDPANMYRFLSFNTFDDSAQQIPPGQTLRDPLPVATFLSGFHQLSFGYALYDEAGEERASAFVGSQQITLAQVQRSVPEPGTMSLLAAGLAGIWLATRRRVRLA